MKKLLCAVAYVAALVPCLVFAQTPDPPGEVRTVVRPGTPYAPQNGSAPETTTTGSSLTPIFVCPNGYTRVMLENMRPKCAVTATIIDGRMD